MYDGKIASGPNFGGPIHGGIMGVMDFPVAAVRHSDGDHPAMCVLETPLDRLKTGEFQRPSHCDVVNSVPKSEDVDELAARRIIYNQILEQGKLTNAEHVEDADLEQFLPRAVKDATNNQQ